MRRAAHPPRSASWTGAAIVVALALVGVAAALLPRGPATVPLLVGLVLLGAAGLWTMLRQRRQARETARVVAEHRMLRESVEHNPMPFAVYDNSDCLIAWNPAYEATHAEAFRRLRDEGAGRPVFYADLVRVTAQATLPPDQVDAHVAERLRRQREADGLGVDREYPGLGWLRVCKFITPSGAVAGFAVDINELKQREAALRAQIELSEALARQLRERADTDALTGTLSRRAFLERAEEDFQRSRRYAHPLSVAMLDVDAFKAVNDRYGHGTGDQVLARVAAACTAQLRSGIDLCGRLGGEEFAILLPETSRGGASCLAERLCACIRSLDFEGAGEPFRVSVSVGVGTLNGEDASFAALLARADAALYQAKVAGRDRVAMSAD